MTDKEINKSKPKQIKVDVWKSRVESLIFKVDTTCKPEYFSTIKKFMIGILSVLCIIFGVLVFLVYYSALSVNNYISDSISSLLLNQTNVTTDQVYSFVTYSANWFSSLSNLLISVVAVIITLFVLWFTYFLVPSNKKEIADSHFRKHWSEVNVEDRPYFKALVNMKYKEISLSLSHIYSTNPELFSQKALIKSLYD